MGWGAIGTAIGTAISWIGSNAAAIGAIASVASTAYSMTQSPGGGSDIPGASPVMLGANANPIDKTTIQSNSELGKLQLGEDEMDKSKRKKGKAAFKIALADDANKKDTGGDEQTGVQVAKPEDVGAQL
jgi:hypothetical protein